MTARSDVSLNWNLDPRVLTINSPSVELTVQDLVDTCRNLEDQAIGDNYDFLIDAAGKEDLGSGVMVGITASAQNLQIAFQARTTSVSEGTATSDDANGQILIDTSATFQTDGVEPGAIIINFTDGSVATVLEVNSQIEIYHEPLDDGTNDDWEIGDSYKIWNWTLCELTGGNTVAYDSLGSQMDVIQPRFGVSYVRTSSSSATLQELDAIQYSSYQNSVWVDVGSSNSGTEYPIGTREYPVNNLTDAVAIANDKGFNTLQILASMTLDSGTDIDGFLIIGKSRVDTVIIVDTLAETEHIVIERCNVSGILDGCSIIRDCMVGDIDYFNGQIHDSGLYGTIYLNGAEEAVLANCYTFDQDNPPAVDMGGSGQDLAVPNYSGLLTIGNLTSATEEIGVGLNAGMVTLLDTITAGTIIISGVGILTDNSTGTASVDSSGLINNTAIATAVWADSDATGLIESVARALGLMQENYYLDETVYTTYSGTKLLTSGRLRTYSDPASVGTANDVLATYTITASWTDDELDTYGVVKQ